MTLMSTVPSTGSGDPAASSALAKARPKVSAMPSTSPVLRISGPSTGSTSGNMVKGKTDSLTPTCGTFRRGRSRSAILAPIISRTAILAIGMSHTFDTSGTVRDARGLASST